MLFTTTILALALSSLASAKPAKQPEPRILHYDDVILPRADGGYDIMKRWEWSHIELRMEREARRQAEDNKRAALSGATLSPWANLHMPSASKRDDCEESTEVQVLTDTNFTDVDVAMSPVIGGNGGQATVAVTKGYSVANSLTVGISETFTFIKDVFQASMSIDYGTTWTSTDTQTFTYWVTAGEYGVVVSNPFTRRLTGNVNTGCTDSPTSTTFSADSRSSQTYAGDLSWVRGPIYLCNSTVYPVPYCVGDGTHT